MRILKSSALLTAAALLSAGPAHAGFPDDVSLSQLASYDGAEVTNLGAMNRGYQQVVKELGVSIANKNLGAAETLGVYGFDVAVTNSVAFINAKGETADDPTGWQRTHETGEPTTAIWVPGVTVRKGLPLSLEGGLNFGYVAFSRQTTIGAFGRWGIIEGYRSFPDLSIQVGYASYLGNPELQLGVMDSSLTLGYTIPFGTMVGINSAQFSPYAGVGVLRMNASPNLSATDQDALGISPVSGFAGKDTFQEGFSPVQVHAGFRIVSGDVQVLFSGSYAIGSIATASTGLGYIF